MHRCVKGAAAWLMHELRLYLTGYLEAGNPQIPGSFAQDSANFRHPESAFTMFALTFAGLYGKPAQGVRQILCGGSGNRPQDCRVTHGTD